MILWSPVGVTFLWSSFSIYFQCWCIRRFNRIIAFVVDFPPAFGGLKLFSWLFSSLGLFNKLLLSVGFDGSHANFYLVEKVMLTCLKQHRQWHTCRAHERKVVESLYAIPYKFSSFLDRRKEFAHGHLGIILVESGEESGFQVEPRIDRVRRETPEPIKGYPLECANEQSGHDTIITYYITGWRLEVVNVLIWRALAIIRVQHWWLEL